jgi:Uma2 family endonuclease
MRWAEIVADPALQDLPYKVETNARGQIILSPHSNRHSKTQRAVQKLLDRHVGRGEVYHEFAIATPEGIKTPDVVWASSERETEMEATGDPSTLAPEICVEVLSPSNTEDEMEAKRRLYRDRGAEEIWIVGEDGRIRFYAEEEMESSELAPECPKKV